MKSRPVKRSEFRQLKDSVTGELLDVYDLYGREVSAPIGMPRSIQILGRHFEIRYHTKLYSTHSKKIPLSGCVLYAQQVIFLDATLPRTVLKETLYHECGHVYLLSYFGDKAFDGPVEERVCDLLASAMLDREMNPPAVR